MDYSRFISDTDNEYIKNYKIKQYSKIRNGHINDVLSEKNTKFICGSVGCVGNLAFVINQLYFFKGQCENIYIDFTKKELTGWENKENPYDVIFDQKCDENFVDIHCWGLALFDYDKIILDDIRKQTQSFFKFNSKLVEKTNNFALEKNIGNKTLGVHIRMNDMNAWHGNVFGYVYYEDYVKEINRILSKFNIENIFVASDNYETLEKLKQKYGSLITYAEDVSREPNEQEEGTEDELREKGLKRLSGEYNFISPFTDLLLLMKCGYIIGRKYSNFTSAAVFLGNTKYEYIINLPRNLNI
jgi:hypothetical protein